MSIVSKAATVCGIVGALALVAATPSSAQIFAPPYYGAPYGYAPYGYYGYYGTPDPQDYDSGGAPYWGSELGWQPGWRNGAPANPCWLGQRIQNCC